MKLIQYLSHIKKYLLKVRHHKSVLEIFIETKKIDSALIESLYCLLNELENSYFITIHNIPYCLMPDATDHIIYGHPSVFTYNRISICKECSLKRNCPGWQEDLSINPVTAKPVNLLPNEIVIEVTKACNLNCISCNINNENIMHVGMKRAKEIVNEAKQLGIKAIRFTGGEPLLNPDLWEMLSCAKKMGFYILLNTNATLIDQKCLKRINQTVDNALISLQGYDTTSDRILTQSNYDFNKKIGNILKIKSRIPITRIGTIISKPLLNKFDRYVDLLEYAGIDTWELYRPMLKNPRKEFMITRNELIIIMHKLARIRKGINARIANAVPFCINGDFDLALSTLVGASADDGHTRIVWDTNGYFKPSYFINKNLGASINEALAHPFLKKILAMKYLPSKCKECRYLKWCKGGSRVIAKNKKGNYFSSDPLMR